MRLAQFCQIRIGIRFYNLAIWKLVNSQINMVNSKAAGQQKVDFKFENYYIFNNLAPLASFFNLNIIL